MVCKIIQPWWIRKQIALTVARLPSWGLRCCRPKEPLSEPRRGEFRRRAANRRANRTGNAACQEIVFESSWRHILRISFLNVQMNVVKNSLVKIGRHDDSKTISWHAAFPVRFARRLAALRLNSPLRGSDSGSLGRQHRKPHDGSLATVRAICFRIHHGCIILRTIFYNAVRLHIAKSSWFDRCLLSRRHLPATNICQSNF